MTGPEGSSAAGENKESSSSRKTINIGVIGRIHFRKTNIREADGISFALRITCNQKGCVVFFIRITVLFRLFIDRADIPGLDEYQPLSSPPPHEFVEWLTYD